MTLSVGCKHCGEMVPGFTDAMAIHLRHCPALQRQREVEQALAEFLPAKKEDTDDRYSND